MNNMHNNKSLSKYNNNKIYSTSIRYYIDCIRVLKKKLRYVFLVSKKNQFNLIIYPKITVT